MTRTLVALCGLLLASCGPKTLTLPADPVERAATCGAVTAAAERGAAGVGTPLSLEALGRVLHYPMLAGAAGESFSSDRAAEVQKRMAELQDTVAEGKWQELVPVCQSAFPAAAATTVELPAERFEAQLGCDELSDFLRSAIDEQEEYATELGEYLQLSGNLDASVSAGLQSRAGSNSAARQDERRRALATMTKAGPPIAVMRECVARFG